MDGPFFFAYLHAGKLSSRGLGNGPGKALRLDGRFPTARFAVFTARSLGPRLRTIFGPLPYFESAAYLCTRPREDSVARPQEIAVPRSVLV